MINLDLLPLTVPDIGHTFAPDNIKDTGRWARRQVDNLVARGMVRRGDDGLVYRVEQIPNVAFALCATWAGLRADPKVADYRAPHAYRSTPARRHHQRVGSRPLFHV